MPNKFDDPSEKKIEKRTGHSSHQRGEILITGRAGLPLEMAGGEEYHVTAEGSRMTVLPARTIAAVCVGGGLGDRPIRLRLEELLSVDPLPADPGQGRGQ